MLFILQRIFVLVRPLTSCFKTKRSAWKTVKILCVVSLLSHIWIPVFYSSNLKDFCDIMSDHHVIGLVYSLMNMLIPILVTSLGSLWMIVKMASIEHNTQHTVKIIRSNSNSKSLMPLTVSTQFSKKSENMTGEPAINLNCKYSTFTVQNKCNQKKNKLSNRTTRLLIIFGITFFILNTPYFLSWLFYYLKIANDRKEAEYDANFIFVSLQVTELVYILNFSIKFYAKYVFGFKINDWMFYPSKREFLIINFYRKTFAQTLQFNLNLFIETVFGFKLQKKLSKDKERNKTDSDSFKKINSSNYMK